MAYFAARKHNSIFGAPGFEPGLPRSQSAYVNHYTTPRNSHNSLFLIPDSRLLWYNKSMGVVKKILKDLNVVRECREEYRVGAWQCPQVLFIVMGGVTILAILATYYVGTQYAEPEAVVFVVLGVAIVIFSVGHVVVANFHHIAELNKAKSEFVSVASHQLRTPLSSIKWTLGLLLSGRLGRVDVKQLSYLKILRDSSQRMIDLVNDLLDVNRIELGRMVLDLERISLGGLVQTVLEDLASLAVASNIKLEFHDKTKSSLVLGDPHRTRMIIENLVDNAIKYTVGKGAVEVTLENHGPYIKFSVRDEGVGVPKEQQRRIFERFFRADNVLRYRTEGTGLGLYIAKSLVEMSGGKIGFSSEEGKGSTFWFSLPLAK